MQPKLVTHGDLSKAAAFVLRHGLKNHARAEVMEAELANMLAVQRELCFAAGQNAAAAEGRKISDAVYNSGYEAGQRAAARGARPSTPPTPAVTTPSRPPLSPFMPPPPPMPADEAPTRTRTKLPPMKPVKFPSVDELILEVLKDRPRSLSLVCAYTELETVEVTAALNALKKAKQVTYTEGLWRLATPATALHKQESHNAKKKEKR